MGVLYEHHTVGEGTEGSGRARTGRLMPRYEIHKIVMDTPRSLGGRDLLARIAVLALIIHSWY